MIKKGLIGIGAAVVLGLLAFGTDLWSYATTFGQQARESVKRQVPLEFEIDRARKMVGELVPDIRMNMHTIAEEEVEVEHLKEAIARSEQHLGRQREEMLALRQHLNEGVGPYRLAGRSYSADEVRQDLARRFERYQTAEATLASKRQMLAARENSLTAARDKLEGMIAAKRGLEVQVEHLAARLKMVQAAQTTSAVQFDDSHLARAKSLVTELRKRLDVAQRVIEAEGDYTGEIPVEEPVPENIVEQIDDYFDSCDKPAGEREAI